MSEITEEDIVAEAPVVAERIVGWFRERLRIADAELAAARDDRVAAEHQQAAAEGRVVQVEELLAASEELSRQLQRALDSRILIEQAKGLLAGRHGVTAEAAFTAMRHHARSNRRTLHEVASELVSGQTSLEV